MTRRKDTQPDAEAAKTDPVPADVDVVDTPALEIGSPDLASDLPSEPLPPQPARPLPSRRPGVLGPLLGGALAAIGGFALSHYDFFGLAGDSNTAEMTALAAKLDDAQSTQAAAFDTVSGKIATLDSRLAALESAPAADLPDLTRLDALDQRLAAIEAMPADGTGTSAALAAKVAELDRQIAALPSTGLTAEVQAQLDAALARLDAAENAAKARTAEAEAAATAARRTQALDALTTAVTEGRPFAPDLQALADETLITALGPMAETGVPTLATLQADFPADAREALTIARAASTEDGWSDRMVDFLASQTGARSLTPQEGTTPDAILSRAEFALANGGVAEALAELEPLDQAIKAPFGPWIAAASAYVAATAALTAARGE